MKYFSQKYPFSCGPACARMMLHAFGIEVSEDELVKILGAAHRKGTFKENWVKLERHFEVKIETKEESSLEEIIRLRQRGWQVTLLITSDVPHYVLFLREESGKIYMHDPSTRPNRSLLLKNFLKIWQVNDIWTPDKIYESKHFYVAMNRKLS